MLFFQPVSYVLKDKDIIKSANIVPGNMFLFSSSLSQSPLHVLCFPFLWKLNQKLF